jgi:hypothetical protein
MRLATVSFGQARSEAEALLRKVHSTALLQIPRERATYFSSAAQLLQITIPRLPQADLQAVGREILACQSQAMGLFLHAGDLLDAAHELSRRALLFEQLAAQSVDPRTLAGNSLLPGSAGDLLHVALQDRLGSIKLIRQMSGPRSSLDLAYMLSFSARTIRLVLRIKPQPDAAALADRAISFRLEAARLFAGFRRFKDAYFENKFLAELYMEKIRMAQNPVLRELCLKAGESAERAADIFSQCWIDDPDVKSLYRMAAAANSELARLAKVLQPLDPACYRFHANKAAHFRTLMDETEIRHGLD